MIPLIDETSEVQALYREFLDELKKQGFSGDICPDFANRTVLATDNSIYQILPQGVIYPKGIDDLCQLTQLSQQPAYRSIVFSARGGGTGTNGQSLTDGLIVDLSRHMNSVLEINQQERWARVQTGVVKDQLNAALKPFGLFFAPELSTSNRATIGGMINTDASGQGSCLYGKTRDHVLELTTVLMDGSVLHSRPLAQEEFTAHAEPQDRCGQIHRLLTGIESEYREQIRDHFPKLNRCLTGYDLAHIRDAKGRFDLNSVLCGSEGTLGFIAEAKINLLPIPKFSALVVVKYGDFDSALRDATRLIGAQPTSIETIDDKVLTLAMEDIIWQEVESFFPTKGKQVRGVNLVEYTADSEEDLRAGVGRLVKILKEKPYPSCIGQSLAWGEDAVNRIWAMRKKAVGLLGNAKGEARPIPFVEDTAVPPEQLADFISEFRNLLDGRGLSYGMFGHVDCGVLHVRPAIDMKDPEQAKLVRAISDEVAALTQKYHGLLWGEHGKGVRSEYAPQFFGKLYPQLQRIKAAFDPHNQLNPGKIATPGQDAQLLTIDGVGTRGELDRQIPVQTWQAYSEAVYCNGNGACFNWNFADPMCPSWKVTRERIHSPKGRSSLIREWLRQLAQRGESPEQLLANSGGFWRNVREMPKRYKNSYRLKKGQYDFSQEVHNSMMGCLACKSCSGACPIKVDVPSFRSKFLALYYTRYARPAKDYFVGMLESTLPVAAFAPKVYNKLMSARATRWLLSRSVGFEDVPLLPETSLQARLKSFGIPMADKATLKSLSPGQKQTGVILVQDAFTSYFEAPLVVDIALLLRKLGFTPMVAPYKANGKPLHVHGFLHKFAKVAKKNATHLQRLAESGLPLVGIDPAMTLTYRSEYASALAMPPPKVQLLQEWLAQHLEHLEKKRTLITEANEFKLLQHCTEKTNAPASTKAWQAVFEALGQNLDIIPVGCCGMSGTYGHESANRDNSAKLFDLSWRGPVTDSRHHGRIAASGYSCRSQCKREAFVKMPHPAQLLLQQFSQRRTDKAKAGQA